MASKISVSKGCFVFNKHKFSRKKSGKKAVKNEVLLTDDPWYLTFKETWRWVEEKFENLHHDIFSSVSEDLVSFVKKSYMKDILQEISTIPTAVLLTGVNMPDHAGLFSSLCDALQEKVSPHVATLHSHKCKTIRHAVEQMTSQFMNAPSEEDSDFEDFDEHHVKVKKSQCNMLVLNSWYNQQYPTEQHSAGPQEAISCTEQQTHKMEYSDADTCSLSEKTSYNEEEIVVLGHFQQTPTKMKKNNEETPSKRRRTPRKVTCEIYSDGKGNSENSKISCTEQQTHKMEYSDADTCSLSEKTSYNEEEIVVLGHFQQTPMKMKKNNEETPSKRRRTPRKVSCEIYSDGKGNSENSKNYSSVLKKTFRKVNDNMYTIRNCDYEDFCLYEKQSQKVGNNVNKLICQQESPKTPGKEKTMDEKQIRTDILEGEVRRSPRVRKPKYLETHYSYDTICSPLKRNRQSEHEKNETVRTPKQKTSLDLVENSERKKLIVIIPEFEKFCSQVLQELILILRSSIPGLPFVLIMGVATSVAAVHRNLPYRISACLSIKAFQSPPSVLLLNLVLEEILFTPDCPFRLGNKTFCFLMDAFLYYDLSVKGFVQSVKFCMMEHFCGQNWKQLCCKPDKLNEKIKLSEQDIADIMNTPSFLAYLNNVEDEENKKIKKSDSYAQKTIIKLLKQLHAKVQVFHKALKCLNILVADLPKKPFGTHVRELYGIAASSPIIITPEYKECLKILRILSRDELIMKLDKIITFLGNNELSDLSPFIKSLSEYRKKIQEAGMTASPKKSPTKNIIIEGKMSRHAFKEKLMQLSKSEQCHSPFERTLEEFLNFLFSEAFPEMLKPITTLTLAEVIMFDNTSSVRTHIVGAPRAALHTALNDPHFYLECKCCAPTKKDIILASMPDLCIAYKLYRECGRMINMFDWLQAFSAIVDPVNDDVENPELKSQVQARFTRAVAELQLMGFLKTSSRKVDHVTKLYFDGGF